MANPKLIITGGCSYTVGSRFKGARNINWPHHLHKYVNTNLINTGAGGSGNTSISRRVIFQVVNSLKIFDPKELLVGIMWSGPNRRELPLDRVVDENASNSSHTLETAMPLLNQRELFNPADGWQRPTVRTKTLRYRTMHPSHYERTSVLWYKHFQHDIDDMINTLESILRVQWFLKLNNVNYFMTSYMNHVFDNEAMKSDNPDIAFLKEQIDWSEFVDVDSANEWILRDSVYKNTPYFNQHPVAEQMEDFTNKVIIPHLVMKGYIENGNERNY